MTARPYIMYPKRPKPDPGMTVPGETLIDEPGQACFGANDFAPGLCRALHGHHTWELVIVDGSSAGPGYIQFDGRWWRVDPGAAEGGKLVGEVFPLPVEGQETGDGDADHRLFDTRVPAVIPSISPG